MDVNGLVLAAGSSVPSFLPELVALVGAAAIVGYLSSRVRVVPIVGFLLAGVAIGPAQLGLVQEREVVDAAAEIGVILLLFTIGIEFSLERLARMGLGDLNESWHVLRVLHAAGLSDYFSALGVVPPPTWPTMPHGVCRPHRGC